MNWGASSGKERSGHRWKARWLWSGPLVSQGGGDGARARELCLFGGQAITEARAVDDPQAVLAGGGDLAGSIGDDDREAHGPVLGGDSAGLGRQRRTRRAGTRRGESC